MMSSVAVQRGERPLRPDTERCRTVVALIRGVRIISCDGGRRVCSRSLALRKGVRPRMQWAVWKVTATRLWPEKLMLQLFCWFKTSGRKIFSNSRSKETELTQIMSFIS